MTVPWLRIIGASLAVAGLAALLLRRRSLLGRGEALALLALSALLAVALTDISQFDPLAFGGVAAFLTLVALAACYVPARRATRIDPCAALRHD
mgnify:CR=1 FL=1